MPYINTSGAGSSGTTWTLLALGGSSVPSYTPSGTVVTPHQVFGQTTVTISSGVGTASVTLTGSAVFTSATSYGVAFPVVGGTSPYLTSVTLSAALVPIYTTVNASGSSFTIECVFSCSAGSPTTNAVTAGTVIFNWIATGY